MYNLKILINMYYYLIEINGVVCFLKSSIESENMIKRLHFKQCANKPCDTVVLACM